MREAHSGRDACPVVGDEEDFEQPEKPSLQPKPATLPQSKPMATLILMATSGGGAHRQGEGSGGGRDPAAAGGDGDGPVADHRGVAGRLQTDGAGVPRARLGVPSGNACGQAAGRERDAAGEVAASEGDGKALRAATPSERDRTGTHAADSDGGGGHRQGEGGGAG